MSPEPQIILSLPLLALEEERSRATEEWLEDETNGVERWGYIDLSLLVARNMEASEGSVVTRNSLPEKGSECSKWGEKTFNVKRGLVYFVISHSSILIQQRMNLPWVMVWLSS